MSLPMTIAVVPCMTGLNHVAIACQPRTSFNVQGQFAIKELQNAWVGENDAEVTIEVHAVPPINESGPNEWIDEPIVWSISNSSNVSADGRFSFH